MRIFALRLTLLSLALTLACGDDTGPSDRAPVFAARLDAQSWPSDTALAIAFGAPAETTLSVTAARTVSPAQEQEISLALHGFTGPGMAPLGDSTAAGIGSFAILQISGGVVTATTVYRSLASVPGTVTITRLNRADSTVSGTFAFEAALTPDTAPHRHIAGSFTLRLGFVQVFPAP